MPRGWIVLSLVLLAGCGTSARVVRLDTGQSKSLVLTPRAHVAPVVLDSGEFKVGVAAQASEVQPFAHPMQDARRLFGAAQRSGAYWVVPRNRSLVPVGAESSLDSEPPREDVELTRAYLRWCERKQKPGDCLRLLEGGATLNGDGKYALAMALALDSVWVETAAAMGAMVNRDAVLATLVSAATVYFMLWVVPEPVVTKAVAVAMTLGLIGYLGYDTLSGLIQGWVRLVEEVDRATTFDAVRSAGERYGAVMGMNAARIFVMLATAAAGNAAGPLAARLASLPGAAQAAVGAETQVGVLYGAIAQVQSVAITAEGVSIALAPGAVAMTARGTSGNSAVKVPPAGNKAWKSYSGFRNAMGSAGEGKEWHHIVEQTPGNVERFGAEALHNAENVIPLDKALHTRVSAFFSSKRPRITGSEIMTVRQWLATQSLKAQREFGLLAIENVRRGLW